MEQVEGPSGQDMGETGGGSLGCCVVGQLLSSASPSSLSPQGPLPGLVPPFGLFPLLQGAGCPGLNQKASHALFVLSFSPLSLSFLMLITLCNTFIYISDLFLFVSNLPHVRSTRERPWLFASPLPDTVSGTKWLVRYVRREEG